MVTTVGSQIVVSPAMSVTTTSSVAASVLSILVAVMLTAALVPTANGSTTTMALVSVCVIVLMPLPALWTVTTITAGGPANEAVSTQVGGVRAVHVLAAVTLCVVGGVPAVKLAMMVSFPATVPV